MSELPVVTSETDLAVYLILSGFNLIEIQYEPRQNGKLRGFFIFERKDGVDEFINLFSKGQASINIQKFKEKKSELLDRIMNGLP